MTQRYTKKQKPDGIALEGDVRGGQHFARPWWGGAVVPGELCPGGPALRRSCNTGRQRVKEDCVGRGRCQRAKERKEETEDGKASLYAGD